MAARAVLSSVLGTVLLAGVMASAPAVPAGAAMQEAAPACVSEVSGLLLRVEDRFANTVRSFAGDDGAPVRSSLFCPYGNRAAAAPQLSLTMEWALAPDVDVGCGTSGAELQTEDERTTGVVADPDRRVQVLIDAEPDLAEAATAGATSLLALAPAEAVDCPAAAAAGGDDDEGGGGSTPILTILLVLLALGGGAFLVVELIGLGARLTARRREYAGVPGLEGLTPAATEVVDCAEQVAALDEQIAQAERVLQDSTASAAVSTTALRPLLAAHAGRSDVGFLDSSGGRLTLVAAACDLYARLPAPAGDGRADGAGTAALDDAQTSARVNAELADRLARAADRGRGGSIELTTALDDGARTLREGARTATVELNGGTGPTEIVRRLHFQRSTVLLALAVAVAGAGLADTRYWLWAADRQRLDGLLGVVARRAATETAGRADRPAHTGGRDQEVLLETLRAERARLAAECEELERSVVSTQRRGQMTT